MEGLARKSKGAITSSARDSLNSLIPARDCLCGTWFGGELQDESQNNEEARQESDVHDASEYNNNAVLWNWQ